MAATVGNATLLLDIDVHQPARPIDLLPVRLGLADRQPGGLVEMGQQRHPVPGEHPTDRRAGYTQVIPDPVRNPPAGEPQRHDPMLQSP